MSHCWYIESRGHYDSKIVKGHAQSRAVTDRYRLTNWKSVIERMKKVMEQTNSAIKSRKMLNTRAQLFVSLVLPSYFTLYLTL